MLELVKIENITNESITIGGFTFLPNSETIIFDKNDTSTYDKAHDLFEYNWDMVVCDVIDNNKLKFNLNGIYFTNRNQFSDLYEKLRPLIWENKVGYSKDKFSFFFDLKDNKWKVYNPLLNKTFVVQMTEEI